MHARLPALFPAPRRLGSTPSLESTSPERADLQRAYACRWPGTLQTREGGGWLCAAAPFRACVRAAGLFAQATRRQRPRDGHGAQRSVLAAAWHTLAHQERWGARQVVHLHVHIAAEAVVEGELEVRRLAQCAVRADLHTVAAEDAAVEREVPAHELALRHHQRAGWADLHAGAARDTVRRE